MNESASPAQERGAAPATALLLHRVTSPAAQAERSAPQVWRDFVVERRRQIGWSQEELAERTGLSVRTIRNLEIGRIRNPRRASMDLLLEALGQPAPAVHAPAARRLTSVDPAAEQLDRRECLPDQEGEDLVGRRDDVAGIVAAVGQRRVVVLVGPPGVGKSRLAAAAAQRLRGSFRDGVATVELGWLPPSGEPGTRASHLRRLVAEEARLELDQQDVRPLPAVVGAPADRECLIVLDTAEHVVDALAPVVRQILMCHPLVRFLITSRCPLPVASAYVWDVAPLALPSGPGGGPAVELFLRRASAACPRLDLSDRLPEVIELCRRLEGVPSALELAACQIRSVPVTTLLRGEPLLQILGRSTAAALPHQRSLMDSVRWSYDLLGPASRRLLHDLAGRSDLFTVADLAGPAELSDLGGGPATCRRQERIGALADLVDASMVQVQRDADYRYHVLGHVRASVTALQEEAVGA